jgi:hypothetical protein
VTVEQELLALEERFWTEARRADFYREHLAGDTVMVFPEPAGIFDEQAIIDSLEDSSPWISVRMEQVNVVRLRDAAVVVAYRAEARRESGDPYRTYAASVYVRQDDDAWRLAYHQQTPID